MIRQPIVVRGREVTWDNVQDILDEMLTECDEIQARLEAIITEPKEMVWWKPWTWLW